MTERHERIGIFGGTFNPVHCGHIHLAEGFLQRLRLDRVLFIPVWSPPHKHSTGLVAAEHRINMCRLACENPLFSVDNIEIKRGGKSYSADTVDEIQRNCPDARLYFIMGADMFLTLESWHRFQNLLSTAAVCAAARHEGEYEKLRRFAARLRSLYGAECHVENLPVADMSSTQIREALSRGQDTDGLLPQKVLDYIKQNGLYTGSNT